MRRSPLVLLALLVVAGCGGGEREQTASPRLPAALAATLATRSDAVAARLEANDPCGARREAAALQAATIAAVNDGRVPVRYQEELGAATSSLLASVECSTPPPGDGDDEEHDDERKSKKDKEKD